MEEEEEALAVGRVWGQCMFAELHVFDHRKCYISSTTDELTPDG